MGGPSSWVSESGVFDTDAQLNRLREQRIRLSRAYERVISPGSGGSGHLLSEADLREAAADGPIVIVNVSELRSDAIVVTAADAPEPVPLKELTYQSAAYAANGYLEALHATEDAVEELFVAQQNAQDGDWVATNRFIEASEKLTEAQQEEELTLLTTLDWLWSAVVAPVKRHVEEISAFRGPVPRIWWCPNGPLSNLPLHAARDRDDRTRDALAWAVSSYTPTVSALLSARRSAARKAAASDPPGFLLLSMSSTPGERKLRHVLAERESIRRRLPAEGMTVLDNEAGTRRRVRDALAAHSRVHLGCHAEQDVRNPSHGGLVLHDGKLGILELGRRRFEGDFAYLSACKTATGGVALSEESVSVAAALFYTGFHRVIATLWSVRDLAAAQIADLVYEHMVVEGRFEPSLAAQALHSAQLEARAGRSDQPTGWAPFVHYGI